MKYQHINQGTCSKAVEFEIDDQGIVHNVLFYGGCNGNLQGIGKLVEGLSASEIIQRLRGIRCNGGPTSCPDQLAQALEEVLKGQKS